jgi:hypothetical protein
MGFEFDMPPVAGVVLVRSAIQSPNYVTTISGWTINQDGSAEFNNILVRGDFMTSSPTGAYVKIYSTPFGGSEIDLQPPDFTDPTLHALPATIQAKSFNGTDAGSYLHFEAPHFIDRDNIYLDLYSGDRLSVIPLLDVRSPTTNAVTFHLNGIPMGNGWVAGAGITASNTAVQGTETVQLTAKDSSGNSFTYLPNHIYRVVVTGGVTTANITTIPLFRIRKATAAGQQLDVWRTYCPVAATTFPASYTCYFQVGATQITTDIVLTVIGAAGINVQLTGAPSSPATLNVYDDGEAPSRAWVATMV